MDVLNFPKAPGFKIKNKSATTAELVLYGDIGDSLWYESISAKSLSDELKLLDKSVNQIDVRINSPGGDVFDGITIYNRLKQHKAKIVVYIDGLAASIASVIALAADEIIIGEGALMMVHKPWTMVAGDSFALEDMIDRLNDIEDQIIGIYQRRTKLDRAELKKMVSEETWMDAKQALELGFVDRIMEEKDGVAIAASLDHAVWMKKKPSLQTANEMIKNEIDKILKG